MDPEDFHVFSDGRKESFWEPEAQADGVGPSRIFAKGPKEPGSMMSSHLFTLTSEEMPQTLLSYLSFKASSNQNPAAIKPSYERRPIEAGRRYDPNIHRLDCYDMKKKRVAFMMCVTEGRAGAEEDIKKMNKWFKTFKFTLLLGECKNPDRENLMEKLKKFRGIINLSNEEMSCCLITLMSHGKENGYILDKDNREISLDKIFSLFNNKTCPKLQGKPKIFIIQACRGERRDYGTLVADGKPVEPDTWSRPKLPTVSDYFIVYSSQREHIAVRDENTGSEMISAMDEVFSEHGTQWHIGDLFTKVNSKMVQRDFHLEDEEESVKVSIVMESTLTKALYLSAD